MSTVENEGTSYVYTFSDFTNTVSVSKNDPLYCGTYSMSLDYSGVLKLFNSNPDRIELKSSSSLDYENYGSFTATLSVTLGSWTSSSESIPVDVFCDNSINNLNSGWTNSVTMNVGATQTFNFPSYTFSCPYNLVF